MITNGASDWLVALPFWCVGSASLPLVSSPEAVAFFVLTCFLDSIAMRINFPPCCALIILSHHGSTCHSRPVR
jgi:hypothetical protein